MKPFGERWRAPVVAEKQDAPDGEGAPAEGPMGPCIPACVVATLLLVLIAVIYGAGANPVAGARPKALVVVLGGVKGTVFEALGMQGHRAPNLRRLFHQGQYAACRGPTDTRCARAQSGRRLGASNDWDAAPGVASILTGVDAPKHGVFNGSAAALRAFARASQRFPTFVKRASGRHLRTAAVGCGPLLTSVDAAAGSCSRGGVLDFECGEDGARSGCMAPASCSLDARRSLTLRPPVHDPRSGAAREVNFGKAPAAEAERRRRRAEGGEAPAAGGTEGKKAAEAAGPLPYGAASAEAIAEFVEAESDVIVAYFGGPDATRRHTTEDVMYGAELYKADAAIGAAVQALRHRAVSAHENWLVLVVSDRGGPADAAAPPVAINNDEDLVVFGGAVLTPSGPMRLKAPLPPTRQFDAAATVLRWFNLLDGAGRLDGRPQLICTSGYAARNCTDADYLA